MYEQIFNKILFENHFFLQKTFLQKFTVVSSAISCVQVIDFSINMILTLKVEFFLTLLLFRTDAQLLQAGWNHAVGLVRTLAGTFDDLHQATDNLHQATDSFVHDRFDNYFSSSRHCDKVFELRRDQSGVIFGLVTIRMPDNVKNILKVELSLAAKLPSVRNSHYHFIKLVIHLCIDF